MMGIVPKLAHVASSSFGHRGKSMPLARSGYVLSASVGCTSADAARIAYYRGERDRELAAVDRIDNWDAKHFNDDIVPLNITADVRKAHQQIADMMERMARAYEGW